MNPATHSETFYETCVRAHKAGGSRITQARLAVIDALSASDKAMTAKDVMIQVRRGSKHATADLVSVYRTLERLKRLNLVHESPGGGFLPCRHAACGHDAHVMLRCRRCARVSECDIQNETIRPLLRFLESAAGFRVTGPAIQMDGLCGECHGV